MMSGIYVTYLVFRCDSICTSRLEVLKADRYQVYLERSQPAFPITVSSGSQKETKGSHAPHEGGNSQCAKIAFLRRQNYLFSVYLTLL